MHLCLNFRQEYVDMFKKSVIHYFLQCSGTNAYMDGVLPVGWVLQAAWAEFVRGPSCPGGATSLMGWVMHTYNWGTVAYIIYYHNWRIERWHLEIN